MARRTVRGALGGAILILATASPAQIVQVQGGGLALANAAQAAAPGTTFVVQPGRYTSTPWSAVDATIVAPQGATIVGYFSVSRTAGSLRMKNISIADSTRCTAYGCYPNPGTISSSGVDIVLDNVSCASFFAGDCTVAVSNSRISGDVNGMSLRNVDGVFTDTSISGGIFFSYYGPFSYAGNAGSITDSNLRMERVTISATSLWGGGVPGAGNGISIAGDSIVTFADSQLSGGPGGYSPGQLPGIALTVTGKAEVILSSTTTSGGVVGTTKALPLATAERVSPTMQLGGPVDIRFSDTPTTPVIAIVSWDFAPFRTPLVAEQLFVFGTPNNYPIAAGVTDPQGHFTLSLTLPPAPGLRYSAIWFTGIFGIQFPLRSSAPIGGIVQ